MPQVDLEALDTRTLYTQCFEIFKKDVIQEGFSIELESRIVEILEALQDLYSNRDDITDILPICTQRFRIRRAYYCEFYV